MRRFPIRGLLLVMASLAATPIPAQDNPWKSETFLSDYTLLKPVPSKKGQDYVYVAPGTEEKLARFDKVMVDQPEISVSTASPYNSAKPDDLRAISEFMRVAITERLKSRGYGVVDKKGENVLYLRTAVTDLQLKKRRRGVLAYTPVGAVVHAVKTAVQDVMKNVDIIDMAGQAELSASTTGELLGEMVSKHGVSAKKPGSSEPERMTFDEFKSHVEEYSDRLVCRLDNGRRPPDQRVDCTDPAARTAASGGLLKDSRRRVDLGSRIGQQILDGRMEVRTHHEIGLRRHQRQVLRRAIPGQIGHALRDDQFGQVRAMPA